jgi:hypothetical protein
MLSLSQAELMHAAGARIDARRALTRLDVTAAGVATAMSPGGARVFKQLRENLRSSAGNA